VSIHHIRKGLNIPISGAPRQRVEDSPSVTRVALIGDDYHGLRVRLLVDEGAEVRRGQPLFEDKRNPGVPFTSPGAGKVAVVNRGARRVLQSVVIQLSPRETEGSLTADDFARFQTFPGGDPAKLDAGAVRALLVESGMWTALRERPFSKVPNRDAVPYALFINAMDTAPLAPNPEFRISEREEDFSLGVKVLSKLQPERTFVCLSADAHVGTKLNGDARVEQFDGPHPAGNAGVHMSRLAPVTRMRKAWWIGYQDVIAIGELFRTGKLPVDRVISLAGPAVKTPRLIATRVGASIRDLTYEQALPGDTRILSGSVLSGKIAGDEVYGFLSRYDNQITVLFEDRDRVFMGWSDPGFEKFSVFNLVVGKFLKPGGTFPLTTTTHGSPRALLPLGQYERVMPFDIMPTFLLRSLMVGDLEQAERLGVLELDEEDVALLTFVDPGKTDFGPILRRNLDLIEKEG